MHRITRWDICSTSLRSSNLITAGLAPFVTDWDSVGHGVAAPLTQLTSRHQASLSPFRHIFKTQTITISWVWSSSFSKINKNSKDACQQQQWFPSIHMLPFFSVNIPLWGFTTEFLQTLIPQQQHFAPFSCVDEHWLNLWGKMLTQNLTAWASTHTCSIMDTSWQHLGRSRGPAGEGGMTAAFQTQPRPNCSQQHG